MTIKFVGDTPKDNVRWASGLPTLDKALMDAQGNRGVPGNAIIEIYGPTGVGKTTLATDVAGTVGREAGQRIDFLDLEGQSKVTIKSILENRGFDGEVNWTMMQAKETPEATIERWTNICFEDEAGIGIIDSVGAYTASAELTGGMTDRNVGLKPTGFGNVTGRLTRAIEISKKPRLFFLLNHEHPVFGSFGAQTTTSGGAKKDFLLHVKIRLQMGFLGKSVITFDPGYLVKGVLKKNRYGFTNYAFYAFIMRGQGIHRGLTNMWECIALKEAALTAEKIGLGTSVKMAGTNYGKLGDIFNDRINDPDFFKPFYQKLQEMDAVFTEEEANAEG